MDDDHWSAYCQLGLWSLRPYLSKIMNHPVSNPSLPPGDFHPLGPIKKGLGGKRLATVLYVCSIITCTGSRDGVIGILPDERPTNLGLDPGKLQAIFTFQKYPFWIWGPPILVLNGCLGSFPGVKRPRREVNHSSPSSAEMKNVWS